MLTIAGALTQKRVNYLVNSAPEQSTREGNVFSLFVGGTSWSCPGPDSPSPVQGVTPSQVPVWGRITLVRSVYGSYPSPSLPSPLPPPDKDLTRGYPLGQTTVYRVTAVIVTSLKVLKLSFQHSETDSQAK